MGEIELGPLSHTILPRSITGLGKPWNTAGSGQDIMQSTDLFIRGCHTLCDLCDAFYVRDASDVLSTHDQLQNSIQLDQEKAAVVYSAEIKRRINKATTESIAARKQEV